MMIDEQSTEGVVASVVGVVLFVCLLFLVGYLPYVCFELCSVHLSRKKRTLRRDRLVTPHLFATVSTVGLIVDKARSYLTDSNDNVKTLNWNLWSFFTYLSF